MHAAGQRFNIVPITPHFGYVSYCAGWTAFVSISCSLCFSCFHSLSLQELANPQEKTLEEPENKNQQVVLDLYDALRSQDVGTVHQILAPDLEWWFHGPPSHQFMMHLLTGASSASDNSFEFVPLSVTSFGPIVIAEGCDNSRQISWVHAWTVTDGIITQVREYFNTSLTVTRLGNLTSQTQSKQSPPSDFSSKVEINPVHCPCVWESSFSNRVGKSVPGLVLAI
ncbi:Wound-induced protein 1-like [Melia azedarach]|uniref:Wound-induced protein 1-like n=1 Tax=Melia azedarach TaxID=155640 RepID=A0ACC1Y9N5_MELAZ|nr:Wound-induced protein 1-like [Melia azedarach]